MPTSFNTVHSWHWILWDNKVFSLNDLFAFEGFPAVPDEPRTRTTSLGNSVIPLVVQDLCRLACSDGRSYYRLFNTTKSTSEYDNATLPEQPAEKSIMSKSVNVCDISLRNCARGSSIQDYAIGPSTLRCQAILGHSVGTMHAELQEPSLDSFLSGPLVRLRMG